MLLACSQCVALIAKLFKSSRCKGLKKVANLYEITQGRRGPICQFTYHALRPVLDDALREHACCGALQQCCRKPVLPTWPSAVRALCDPLQGVRIDFALLSPGLLDRLVSCEVLPTHPKWSDHAAVLLELRDSEPPEAPSGATGTWQYRGARSLKAKMRSSEWQMRDDTNPGLPGVTNLGAPGSAALQTISAPC